MKKNEFFLKKSGENATLAAVGRNIRLARRRRGISKSRLAGMSGISRPTLDRIEEGCPNVTMDKIESVLRSMGMEGELSLLASRDEQGIRIMEARLMETG